MLYISIASTVLTKPYQTGKAEAAHAETKVQKQALDQELETCVKILKVCHHSNRKEIKYQALSKPRVFLHSQVPRRNKIRGMLSLARTSHGYKSSGM